MPDTPRVVDVSNVSATPNAAQALEANGVDVSGLLARHASGDWGDLTEEDKFQNDLAAYSHIGRVRSLYHLPDGSKILVITEWNLALTTVATWEEL